MNKHLPFFLYAIFSTLGVIITIVLPNVLPDSLTEICKQLIGGISGILASLLGSWITYYTSGVEMKKLKDVLNYEEDENGNPSVDAPSKWGEF